MFSQQKSIYGEGRSKDLTLNNFKFKARCGGLLWRSDERGNNEGAARFVQSA